MSPLQTAKYFREWGKVRAHYIAQGIDPKQVDAKRHELHRKALGAMKSSKAFTNSDLDKVLATFYSITRPADLNAQLHQIEQPLERLRGVQHALLDLAAKVVDEPGREKAYVKGLAEKIFLGIEYTALTESQLQQIAGIVRARIKQIRQKNEAMFPPYKQPVGAWRSAGDEPEGEDPF